MMPRLTILALVLSAATAGADRLPLQKPPRLQTRPCSGGTPIAKFDDPISLKGPTTITLYDSGAWCDSRSRLSGALDRRTLAALETALARLKPPRQRQPCGLGAYPRRFVHDVARNRAFAVDDDQCTRVHVSVKRLVKQLLRETLDHCTRGRVLYSEERWPLAPDGKRIGVVEVHTRGLAESLVGNAISRSCLNRRQVRELKRLIARANQRAVRDRNIRCRARTTRRSVLSLGRWRFEWEHPCGGKQPRPSVARIIDWVRAKAGLSPEAQSPAVPEIPTK